MLTVWPEIVVKPCRARFVLAVWVVCLLVRDVASQCVRVNECSCKAGDFLFSLNTLVASPTDPNPRFPDVKVTGERASIDTSSYSYHPCHPMALTEATCTDDVAVCQKAKDVPTGINNGDWRPVTFAGDPRKNTLNLIYTHMDGSNQRQSRVKVQCAKTLSFRALGETKLGSMIYEFVLETPLACYSKGLSVGSILIILFFVAVLSYLVIGVLYMRFMRGARGVEQIPNLEFWKGLPGAAKDGVVFVMSGCKTDSTYSQI